MTEKRKLPTAKTIFHLRISLRDVDPEIWRRVLVPGTMPLDKLHDAIQAVFGWWDYHLHAFNIGALRYGIPDDFGFEDVEQDLDEHGVELVGDSRRQRTTSPTSRSAKRSK